MVQQTGDAFFIVSMSNLEIQKYKNIIIKYQNRFFTQHYSTVKLRVL